MSLVFLRTDDGRFLSGGADPEGPLDVLEERRGGFEWVETGAGGTLRSLVTGQPLFMATRVAEDAVVLRSAGDGQYLSIAPGDGVPASTADVDGAARLTLEHIPVAEDHGCCGPGHARSVHPAWEETSHSEAVNWGGDLLVKGLSPEADLFQKFWTNETFRQAVRDGVRDADRLDPWRGTGVGDLRAFQNHFYNPQTENNFFSDGWHALCDGRRYFNLSVHEGRRLMRLWPERATPQLIRDTGFLLGLSTHFIADLTQPMHTVNFANILGGPDFWYPDLGDYRHRGFEQAGDRWITNQYKVHYAANPLKPQDVAVRNLGEAGHLLVQTARNHRPIFDSSLRTTAARKQIVIGGRYHYINDWSPDEARPALEKSLLFTPKSIARWFALWAERIQRDPGVVDTKWYRVISFRSQQPVMLKDEWFQLGPQEYSGFDAQFCFVFNPNGSWTVVCRANPAKAWHMREGGNRAYLMEGLPDSPPVNREFRFAPFGPGLANVFWIFESTQNKQGDPEVLGVERGAGPKITRWKPNDDSQLYYVFPVDDLAGNERTAVSQHWPEFGKNHWWGERKAGDSP
jgi:hypothetical protein